MSRAQRRAAWLGRHRMADRPAAPGPAARSRPAVRLHIGELGLHGLPPLSRHDVAEAVCAELTGLIAAEGLPAQLLAAGGTERLRGVPITLSRDGQARAAGSRIARSVFGGSGR
jgi:hypothetical protein